jgi:hypothetical protein
MCMIRISILFSRCVVLKYWNPSTIASLLGTPGHILSRSTDMHPLMGSHSYQWVRKALIVVDPEVNCYGKMEEKVTGDVYLPFSY